MLLRLLIVSTLFFANFVNSAGYVEKGHYLYPIMVDIRYKKYDEAMEKLEPYAEKGDAQALFWYGYMKQESFGRDRYGAYHWYEKSIEGGNPYSMFKLSDGRSLRVCEANGWECPEENFDKAIERWKELAEQGDSRAEYHYRYYSRSFFEKVYDAWFSDNNEQAIITAAKKGYNLPLARSIKDAYGKDYREFWGDDMYQALLENIDKNPVIAMYFVHNPYAGMNNEERRNLYLDSLSKGYGGKHYDWAVREGVISSEEAYVFRKAEYIGTGEEFYQKRNVKKFNIEEKKIPELNKRSEEFFNSIEHVINFDEMDFMYRFKPDV
ncbi:MAG: hypothetical protein OIF58_16840 [Cohaesibacter sp.]|nr:hypothetical protein [Cohaesibacter sp.]